MIGTERKSVFFVGGVEETLLVFFLVKETKGIHKFSGPIQRQPHILAGKKYLFCLVRGKQRDPKKAKQKIKKGTNSGEDIYLSKRDPESTKPWSRTKPLTQPPALRRAPNQLSRASKWACFCQTL